MLQHSGRLHGDRYEILTPAADALAGKHPLAATVVLRAMIDFSLANSRSSRYKHAARHLLNCSSLSPAIEDFGGFEPHDAYEARLRREHGRKSSFWRFEEHIEPAFRMEIFEAHSDILIRHKRGTRR